MSENNLAIETQRPPSPNDGSEILASAQASNKKGVTRRDFLKLSGAALASWLLSGCQPDQPQSELESATSKSTAPLSTSNSEQAPPTERFLQPELVHKVEVYGLGERITLEEQITRLYGFLDEKFARENNITIRNIVNRFIPQVKVEQRKEVLDPNERYLEVVIRQSAYDSFSRRRQETGVDFVEWIQMHVDAMNRCFENAKPPADMKSVLRRIVVISDDMPRSFYDESKKNKLGGALDAKWTMKFKDRYPLDTDCSWAIADDYRVNTTEEIDQGYFWKVYHQDGQTVFGHPPGANNPDKTYVFPERNDSIQGKNGVWLDFGLTHEWSHYLCNTPDESRQNFHQNPKAIFDQFIFDTNNFQEPYLSPYRSYLIARNIRQKLRDVWGHDGRTTSFLEEEPTVQLIIDGLENPKIELRKNRFDNNNLYGKKSFPDNPDQQGENGLTIDKDLFEGVIAPTVWSCRIASSGKIYEVFIPAAAFAMSSISGMDEPHFNIEITGYQDSSKKTQIVKLVDESEIEKFLAERQSQNDTPYAKMKVDGTDTWFVWFLRD